MIVWSGWGFLGLLVPMLTAFFTIALVNAVKGASYASVHLWPMGLGVLLGAACLYLLSQRLDRPGRTLVDPATGQTVVLKPRHTLFFIPLRWISAIVAVIGLVLLFMPARPAAGNQPDDATVQQQPA